MTMQKSGIKIKFWILICGFAFCLLRFAPDCFAQEETRLAALTNKIIAAKPGEELYSSFKELTGRYFKDNKYNECAERLKSLAKKRKDIEPLVNYHIALTRYYQLKYLQDSQDWNDYFNNGDNYRSEMIESAQKAIDKTTAKDPLNIYAKLVLWRLHKDQEDTLADAALSDLMNAVSAYSKEAAGIALIKEVADELKSYGEKAKSKELYKIYVDRVAAYSIKDEDLKSIAYGFYKEGSQELAEQVYDVYIDRSIKTLSEEKLIPVLAGIAKQFSVKSEGIVDMAYAEKLFKKIEEIAGKDVFDEGLLYLRALNLEKMKEYNGAKDAYIELIGRYPKCPHIDEANYKVGIIYCYVLRDIKTGKSYFEKMSQKETLSSQVISSLYQLGLLSRWEGEETEAKQYYDKLIEKAKGDFSETVTLAKERLKEIEEARPVEYNLKTFMELSLKEENAAFDSAKVDLRASPPLVEKNKNVALASTAYTGQTGCMQVELKYLWSGHLGTVKPEDSQSAFDTRYAHPGTKEINLVVVSPSGVVDRSIVLVDVY